MPIRIAAVFIFLFINISPMLSSFLLSISSSFFKPDKGIISDQSKKRKHHDRRIHLRDHKIIFPVDHEYPSPDFAPIISAATRTIIEWVALSLKPVIIDGRDEGMTTFLNSEIADEPIERADFISSGSTLFTPLIVFNNIGHCAPRILQQFLILRLSQEKVWILEKVKARRSASSSAQDRLRFPQSLYTTHQKPKRDHYYCRKTKSSRGTLETYACMHPQFTWYG